MASLRVLRRSAISIRPTWSLSGKRWASHGSNFNEPTGYLFAEKPQTSGRRQLEDWEPIYYIGMFGGMALAAVLLAYKPDTSIQTWATAEAQKRLEEKGELPTYTSTARPSA